MSVLMNSKGLNAEHELTMLPCFKLFLEHLILVEKGSKPGLIYFYDNSV